MNKFFRIIPTLLLMNGGLVKTVNFKKPNYIGDPINIVKIFNEKEADEITILDISATRNNSELNYDFIRDIISEAFMPVGYGGGIKSLCQIEKLFEIGVEKVILNSACFKRLNLIQEASEKYGNQSIVVCVDIKKNLFGKYNIFSNSGEKKQKISLEEYIKEIENSGAGEIIVNSIDRDGTMKGYDLDILKEINKKVKTPLIALGGAGTNKHLKEAIEAGISGVAAGSLFIYQGVHKAVLISYIKNEDLFEYHIN
tara:strand:- start:3003 stop:3767 length:765 start_codon:yes stop_codon:yes gene_type:complete